MNEEKQKVTSTKKSSSYIPLIIVVVVVLLGGGFLLLNNSGDNSSFESSGSVTRSENDKVPEFSFPDYDGNIVSSTDYAGKPIVVNSWATWCPFCVDELPDFVTVQEEFGDAVTIISIDRAESSAQAKTYTDDLGVTDGLVFLLDADDKFYQAIGGFSMPETLFVDSDGNIVEHKRGPMKLPEIREKIQSLIDNN